MGVDILANEDDTLAVFYCNSSDWAFGPVMEELPGYDGAYETAEAFLGWLELDARRYDDHHLESKWAEFRVRAERMANYTKADYEADQADMAHSDGEVP